MRDCENCARNKPQVGCTSWDCDYINRMEAIHLYEEVRKKVGSDRVVEFAADLLLENS